MAAVELKQITKNYDGKLTIIHGIDLEIQEGEFVVFVGPSGCGKSTLLRMIAGLETVTSGQIVIDGKVVNDEPPRNRDISMVFQDYALYPHKTLYENMAFGLRLRKTPENEIKKRISDVAKMLRIEHMLERKPAALSGGQRQRVAIGRAIVRQPKVFLFDEPLSNLDAQLRNEMRVEIKKLHERLGATMIYVTHDQVEAMTLADRIVVLNGGHKVQYDTPDNIYNKPSALFVAGFTGAPPMNLPKMQIKANHAVLGDQLNLALPSGRSVADGEYHFGIRPENIRIKPEEGDVSVPARVELLEPLGSETLVTLTIGQTEMVARFPATFKEKIGSQLTVYLSSADIHLFDIESGKALFN